MFGVGVQLMFGIVLVLGFVAWRREEGGVARAAELAIEQFFRMMPKMACALIGTGFLVKLIPSEQISRLLGDESGVLAVLIAGCAGVLIPAGPVITFAIAASFANEGASMAALVAFVTSWSVFSAHRMAIFEVPLLGTSFLRIRLLSVLLLPFIAGALVWCV